MQCKRQKDYARTLTIELKACFMIRNVNNNKKGCNFFIPILELSNNLQVQLSLCLYLYHN